LSKETPFDGRADELEERTTNLSLVV